MVNMRKEFGADRRAMLLMRNEREMIRKNPNNYLTNKQQGAMTDFLAGQKQRENLDPSDPRYLAPGQTTAATRGAERQLQGGGAAPTEGPGTAYNPNDPTDFKTEPAATAATAAIAAMTPTGVPPPPLGAQPVGAPPPPAPAPAPPAPVPPPPTAPVPPPTTTGAPPPTTRGGRFPPGHPQGPPARPRPAAPAPAPQNQGFAGGINFNMGGGGVPGAPAPAPAGGGGGASNDPQRMAQQTQVANATAQSQKTGGIGMNPLLNVAGLGIPAVVQGMSNWNQRRQGQNKLREQGQGIFTSFDDPTTAYDSANNIHKNIAHIKIRRTL